MCARVVEAVWITTSYTHVPSSLKLYWTLIPYSFYHLSLNTTLSNQAKTKKIRAINIRHEFPSRLSVDERIGAPTARAETEVSFAVHEKKHRRPADAASRTASPFRAGTDGTENGEISNREKTTAELKAQLANKKRHQFNGETQQVN